MLVPAGGEIPVDLGNLAGMGINYAVTVEAIHEESLGVLYEPKALIAALGSQSSLKNSQNCSSIICSWISEYSCEEVPKLQQFLLMDLRILEIVPKLLQHFLLKHLRILGAVPKLQQGIYSSPKLLISVKQIRGNGVWLVARSKRQSM